MTVAQLARWLPAIDDARRWSQSLAVLDAIVCEDRFYRYFTFDSQFGPGQAQASMWNGSGDQYSITFGEYGLWCSALTTHRSSAPGPRIRRRCGPD